MKILVELEKMVNYYYQLAFLEADDERNLYNELLLDALDYKRQTKGEREAVIKTKALLAKDLVAF